MKRVTLNGIKRRGLSEWKGREWWASKKVWIWTCEHRAWYRTEAKGYTANIDEAGVYSFADAWDHTKHCGPEKKIIFYEADRAH